jgi:DNA processing protein
LSLQVLGTPVSDRGGGGDALWWAALQRPPGIGASAMLRLVRMFGSPRDALAAPVEELMARGKLSVEQARRLALTRDGERELRSEIRSWRDEGIELVCLTDGRYPRLLLDLRSPPPLLYLRGSLRAEDGRAVAIVGTRRPTQEAAAAAQRLARGFAEQGFTIVSGLARGIDTAGHLAALQASGGRTVAIIGCGLRRIYPPENEPLAKEIAGRGCLLSEVPPDTEVQRRLLVARDRIQAALCAAVVVVQAPADCGSIITARHAVRCRRLLYAVPWSHGPFAEGWEQLRAMGARPMAADADLAPICEQVEQRHTELWQRALL